MLFEEQKRFKGCKVNKALPFDFYLPSHNLLIEYDGVAHFKPTTFGGMSMDNAILNLENQKTEIELRTSMLRKTRLNL